MVLIIAIVAVATVLGDRRDVPYEPVSPFGRDASPEAETQATPDVVELAREIASARRGIPPRTAAHLRDVARGRLLDGHRLDLSEPGDRQAVGLLLSPTLAAIVLENEPSRVPVRELDRLLDELEHL
jgi:hypothetical protein